MGPVSIGIGSALKKAATTVFTSPAVVGGIASAAIGSLMQKPVSGAPKAKKPPTAPAVDEKATRRRKEREYQRRFARMGRAGTILSDEGALG